MAERDVFTEIRKLRKKLRQIENLENVQRPLTPEEEAKVADGAQLSSSCGFVLHLAKLVSGNSESVLHLDIGSMIGY